MGRATRQRVLAEHFEQRPVTVDGAWQFVYRELLWVDSSNGLAHLYESDKAQPGRSAWYDRSVRFTDLLCKELGVDRQHLRNEIDHLFRACLPLLIETRAKQASKKKNQPDELALAIAEEGAKTLPATAVKMAAAMVANTPAFVADADLIAIFADVVAKQFNVSDEKANAVANELAQRARNYFMIQRKRQNILGEGFEDLVQLLVEKLTTVPRDRLFIRQKVDSLPGFRQAHSRERVDAPDLAVAMNNQTRVLASIKWSLRQDRQKQLSDELDGYVHLLSQKTFPRYVLVTNEYDPGRLINANALSRRDQRITCIYHISPDFLRTVLSGPKWEELQPLVTEGRLRSIGDFIKDLSREFGLAAESQPLTADQKRLKRLGRI